MKWSGIKWKEVLTVDGLKSILKGCAEHIIDVAGMQSEYVKSVIEYRLDIVCANCEINTDGQCDPSKTGQAIVDFKYHNTEDRFSGITYSGCGCALKCKTANLHEQCPLGKWLDQVR